MENLASTFRGLLQVNQAFRLISRGKGRINVKNPGPTHYRRAKIEYLVKPKYFEKGERESWFIPAAHTCLKEEENALKYIKEDNPYQRLLAKDLRNWFMNSKLIAFFHANPIRFEDRFQAEVRLRKENMYLKNYGKQTVEMALQDTPYLPVMQLFVSHTDMVFCNEPKVDKLMKIASKMHSHVLLAAVVEDRFMSVSQLKALSQLKDLTTARAQLVSVMTAVQTQLVSGLTYHQSSLVSGLQRYAESTQTPIDTPISDSQHSSDDSQASTDSQPAEKPS